MSRIAFVVQLPKGISPGQRFRCEAWEPSLFAAGHSVDTFPFFNERAAAILYKPGATAKKAIGVLNGFLHRILLTFYISRYDFIFVQREASPIGPPIFEWFWSKVLRKKIIYDFDDAIWIPNASAANRLANRFKAFWKVGSICRWAYIVVGGNNFLCTYARAHSANGRVVLIPTVVDTDNRYNRIKEPQNRKIIVGWTGSHSTLKYLDSIVPVINHLQEDLDFTFIVIADKKPDLPIKDWQFIPWNNQTEIEDLLRMDIGIMPLMPDLWSEGKCGFKLIQYLALGIPAIASPVGVNKDIIEVGINGYLSANEEEWECALRKLITGLQDRTNMGIAGRAKIEAEYSLNALRKKFLSLFNRPEL